MKDVTVHYYLFQKNLSNTHLVGIIILIILPSLVLLILSSSIAPSEYNIEEEDNCTSSDVSAPCKCKANCQECHVFILQSVACFNYALHFINTLSI